MSSKLLCSCVRQYRPFQRYVRKWCSSDATKSLQTESPEFPKHARVVICGGGIVGSSVAYHLAERGWTDVVLLEQGKLTCGTTWHAAGLVGQLKSNEVESQVIRYSRDLYKSLADQGHEFGWKECGSLNVARTTDRMILFKKQHAIASARGLETHLLTPLEVKEICSLLRTDDIEGGIWIPSDATVTAPDVSLTLARLAKEKGVKIFEGVSLVKVNTKKYKVESVDTSLGNIRCEYFVNCAGQWAREIGKRKTNIKVKVPLHSCEHYYLVTKAIPGVESTMPILRDHDGYVYFREWSGGILAGGFEPQSRPAFHQNIPEKFEFQLLPEDWDHFQVLLDELIRRVPAIGEAQVRQLLNGPESFTPDCKWILGEAAEVDRYYVAAGMNSNGIAAGGGVGKYMAEWIIDDEPSINMWSVDVKRFVAVHNNKKFLRNRVKESLGAHYKIPYPYGEFTTGRKLRTSTLHTRLEVAGAYFGETNAFERPMWFNDTAEDDFLAEPKSTRTFHQPTWFDKVQNEYWACKERVCLIDMSSFTKLEVKSAGPDALNYLQMLCSNNIDQEIGAVVHTGMQNKYGGYENDTSVVRLEDNYFFIICPTSQQTRALTWLKVHLPTDGSVQVRDVTSMYAGINVIGPHAQELLSDVTDVATSHKDFKFMTCKVIDVGYASGVRAMRLTHSGEDGFILYVPCEQSLRVYNDLMAAGKDYGIRNAGYFALRHLRIEMMFAYWGLDLNPHTTPLECGREFRVKFDKDFIGKEALLKQKEQGVSQKFVQFLLDEFNIESPIWPSGGEPIYRNGQCVGFCTSSGYGFSLSTMVCLAFVKQLDEQGNLVVSKHINDYIMDKNAVYEIEIGGKRYHAKPGIYSPKIKRTAYEPMFIPVPRKY